MRVWGRTLEDLFRNAIRGVASYLKSGVLDVKGEATTEPDRLKIQAVDINSLLVECLSEVVAQSDMHGRVFFDLRVHEFGENFLDGDFSSIPVEAFDNEIRGVSYTDVDIKKNASTGHFETTLVFDI